MKNYEIDIVNEKVYVDPTFVKKSSNLKTPEFKEFMELKRTLPEFSFEEKKLNLEKNTYKGLTNDVMEAFILYYEKIENREIVLKEFKEIRAESVFKKNKASFVRSWFLSKYKKQYNESSFVLNKDGKVVIQKLKNGATTTTAQTTN